MLKVLVPTILFTAYLASMAHAVQIGDCSSAEHAEITELTISECANDSPRCKFEVGKQYTFDIKAKIKSNLNHPTLNSLPVRVIAYYLGIPFVLAEGDLCRFETAPTECPILPQQDEIEVAFSVKTIPLPDSLPPLIHEVTAFARVWENEVTENSKACACASLKISIQDPAVPQLE